MVAYSCRRHACMKIRTSTLHKSSAQSCQIEAGSAYTDISMMPFQTHEAAMVAYSCRRHRNTLHTLSDPSDCTSHSRVLLCAASVHGCRATCTLEPYTLNINPKP